MIRLGILKGCDRFAVQHGRSSRRVLRTTRRIVWFSGSILSPVRRCAPWWTTVEAGQG